MEGVEGVEDEVLASRSPLLVLSLDNLQRVSLKVSNSALALEDVK